MLRSAPLFFSPQQRFFLHSLHSGLFTAEPAFLAPDTRRTIEFVLSHPEASAWGDPAAIWPDGLPDGVGATEEDLARAADAVLATCGVAIGMSLQGALSNVAGGIMLMIFRPFSVGDYVSAGGAEGVVKEISLFYTTITTVDNKVVTVPNGALMNSNVTNFSAEEQRRVDLTFACAKGEDVAAIQELILGVMKKNDLVLDDPAPFARLVGGTNESMEFTVLAWTDSAKYWDTYFALTQEITEALGAAGIKAPAVRVVTESK